MNSKRWAVGLVSAAGAIAVAVVGCTGDTVNNYSDAFGGDSGIDVQVFQSLGCTAGKKECVSDSIARVCPADGSAWVAVSCRIGDKCADGECKSVAGGPTAACVPGDGACLPNNKALRCKADGSGFEQIDCVANTTCFDKGLCRGSQTVGAQQCSGDKKSVMVYADGFNLTKLADCAAGELCVTTATTPVALAACKPAACDPAATCGSQTACGDPLNPGNDQTKYVASCTATPSGYKMVGSPCTLGATCSPTGQQCNQGNRFQAACTGNTCTPGAVRCSPNGQGLQTCKADGTWDATTTQCNLGAGERCLTPAGGTKAVCGDPVCQYALGICDDATTGFRACDANGKLTAAAPCTMGRCVKSNIGASLPPPQNQGGSCQVECTPGSEDCTPAGNDFRVCEANGKWGTDKACPTSDGAVSSCFQYTDPVSGLSKHTCTVGVECSPGQKRCVNGDGGSPSQTGTDSIQVCGLNGIWGAPSMCGIGSCNQFNYSGGAICVADCIPGAKICDPSGSGKYFVCPNDGKFPSVVTYDQTCAGDTTCKRVGARSIGCVQCVGSNLTDNNTYLGTESRCLLDDGGVGAGNGSQIQGCKADNTWDTGFTCSGGLNRCNSVYPYSPGSGPGGVTFGYCN